jgi:hypothetical protein
MSECAHFSISINSLPHSNASTAATAVDHDFTALAAANKQPRLLLISRWVS